MNRKCVVILAHDIKNKDNVVKLAKQCYEKLGEKWEHWIFIDGSSNENDYMHQLSLALSDKINIQRGTLVAH